MKGEWSVKCGDCFFFHVVNRGKKERHDLLDEVVLGRRWARAVDHGVGPCFEAYEDQGEDGEGELQALRAELFFGDSAATPVG